MVDRVALARRIIDFGLTPADLTPLGDAEATALLASAAPVAQLLQTQRDLKVLWPEGFAPHPSLIDPAPASDAPLPHADYLVVTWTVAELQALVDVLTPGVPREHWHRYDRNFTD